MKILAILAVLALGVAVSRAEDKPTLEQARKAFEKADAELNKIYKSDTAALGEAQAAKLRDDERRWISYRDSMATSLTIGRDRVVPDNPKLVVDYWTGMTDFTQDRIEVLRAWTGKNVPQGISGTYSDSYGGDLDLEETKDGIKFSLTAVRGWSHHIGDISGVVQRKGDTADFKEKLDPGDDRPPCELVFTFIEGHIVKITEKAADPDAGMGVHYDGDYYKTGKLEKPVEAPDAQATPAETPTPAPAEKPTLEQARKTFEATDALLTAAYKEAGAGLDPGKMAALRQKQRDWLQYRDMMAESAPFFNTGAQTDAPKRTVDYWQEMTNINDARIDFLRGYSGKKMPAGITGTYSDSYGGTMELEEKKSGIAFSISTVRGMARNTGDIDGIAQRSGDKAVFKDHPDAGDNRAPCEITFTFSEGHIVKVEEKNGDFYHGFNANFDGAYYKTGKLEKPVKPE